MKQSNERDKKLSKLFADKRIADLGDLKNVMETSSTMTVYRYLSRYSYLVSYSHRGRFYTLDKIPEFDSHGLWSYCGVMFSRHGNLLETANVLVEKSYAGFTASELEHLLQVEVKHPLLELKRRKKISRTKFGRHYVYLSSDSGIRRQQTLTRRQFDGELAPGLEPERLPDELKAAIILFFSLLDEKQRRFYAGLEAARLGHGGNKMIAELLGLDPHTVAKGRRQIFSGSVERERIRGTGGGNIPVEKKRQK